MCIWTSVEIPIASNALNVLEGEKLLYIHQCSFVFLVLKQLNFHEADHPKDISQGQTQGTSFWT